MMTEEDDDDFDEEESDFVPLIVSSENDDGSHRNKRAVKKSSFEILQEATPVPSKSTRSKCIVVVLCFVAISSGIALVRQAFQASSEEEETIFLETCKQRFNISYEDLLTQISNLDSYCVPWAPNCVCANPLVPKRPDYQGDMNRLWNRTFHLNSRDAEVPRTLPYDVVFFGDSITEHWNGNDLSISYPLWTGVNNVFNEYFHKNEGGKVDGLALGIGGDRCPQLLYRIQNGELPEILDSKVFWVLIGTNDFGGDKCSPESIVAGTILIAKEIQARRPKSKVVLNSILPRGKPGTNLLEDGVAWPALTEVNRWLECYANENKNVEFFNGTGVFLGGNESVAVPEYYSDPVHPSAEGYTAWANAIVEWLLKHSK